jgi:hypothetical protein
MSRYNYDEEKTRYISNINVQDVPFSQNTEEKR